MQYVLRLQDAKKTSIQAGPSGTSPTIIHRFSCSISVVLILEHFPKTCPLGKQIERTESDIVTGKSSSPRLLVHKM